MRLVDSHAHLQADRLSGEVDQVIGAARVAGVERILVPGWNRWSSEAAVELVGRFDWLDAGVGIHPHDAADASEADWQRIVELARDPRVVAIGETGLDYDRLFSPREAQLTNLRRHLALAVETGRPAILHCRSRRGERDAQDELLAELRAAGLDSPAARAAFGGQAPAFGGHVPAFAGRPPAFGGQALASGPPPAFGGHVPAFAGRPPAVIHSFSGPLDYAEAVLELGLAISFSGLVFRAGEEASAAVARIVPADRLLVETDSPFLAPPAAPRRRNEPAFVGLTAAWLVEQRADDPSVSGPALVAAFERTFPRRTGGAAGFGGGSGLGVGPGGG